MALASSHISIEGIIGSGKTSAIIEIQKYIRCVQFQIDNAKDPFSRVLINQCRLYREPVELFETLPDSDINPLMEGSSSTAVSSDVMSLQLHIIRCLFKFYSQIVNENPCPHCTPRLIITDRSFESCKIFIQTAMKTNRISRFANEMLHREWQNCFGLTPKPDFIIFLDIEPELSLARIKARGRESERDITLDYLKNLREEHLIHLGTLEMERKVKTLIVRITEIHTPRSVCELILEAVKDYLFNSSKTSPNPAALIIDI